VRDLEHCDFGRLFGTLETGDDFTVKALATQRRGRFGAMDDRSPASADPGADLGQGRRS
jgi:hypothetical protein